DMKFNISVSFLLIVVLFIPSLVRAQGTRYAVQLGALQSQTDADARVNELRTKDVQAYIVITNVPGKGIFYRIRVGMFADMNAPKMSGPLLVRRGCKALFFVALFDPPFEARSIAVKPAPTPAPVNTAATTSSPSNGIASSSPPKQSSPDIAVNTPPDNVTSSVPVTAAPAPTTTAAAPAAYARYQDPGVGYSFEYPSYWTGQPLDPKDAADQRVNAGALFKSAEDAAFLNAIWNKLEKANSPEN